MNYWSKTIEEIEKDLDTNLKNGISPEKINVKRETLRI